MLKITWWSEEVGLVSLQSMVLTKTCLAQEARVCTDGREIMAPDTLKSPQVSLSGLGYISQASQIHVPITAAMGSKKSSPNSWCV